MSIIESKYNLTKLLFILAILVGIVTIVMYSQLPESIESFYIGNVTDIEFFGGAVHQRTLVRFDTGNTLIFYGYETKVPLNKEVKFHYHTNGFGYLFLDKFEVIE